MGLAISSCLLLPGSFSYMGGLKFQSCKFVVQRNTVGRRWDAYASVLSWPELTGKFLEPAYFKEPANHRTQNYLP